MDSPAAALLADIALQLVILAFGFSLSTIILRGAVRLEHLSLAYPIGLGIFTWILFLASWAGLGLTLPTIAATALFAAGVAASVALARRRPAAEPHIDSWDGHRRRRNRIVWFVLAATLAGLVGALAVLRSYSAWDGIAIWSVKGYGIAAAESIFGARQWGAFGLQYPLNLPLAIAAVRLIDGDVLPGSKIVFALFYLALVLGCYVFLLRAGLLARVAALGALLIATTPIVLDHGTNGYANLPMAAYLVLGVLYAIHGIGEGSARLQLVSGVLFGLACWTRPEGVMVVGAVMGTLAVFFAVQRRGRALHLTWLTPVLIFTVPWLAFSSVYAGEGEIVRTLKVGLSSIRMGSLHLDAFFKIVRYYGHQLLFPRLWGVLLPVWVLLLALGWLRARRWPRVTVSALLVATAATATMSALHFYAVSFLGVLEEYLATSANRMFLSSAILLTLALVTYAGTAERSLGEDARSPDPAGP